MPVGTERRRRHTRVGGTFPTVNVQRAVGLCGAVGRRRREERGREVSHVERQGRGLALFRLQDLEECIELFGAVLALVDDGPCPRGGLWRVGAASRRHLLAPLPRLTPWVAVRWLELHFSVGYEAGIHFLF